MNLYLRALKYVKAYWMRALAALICTGIAPAVLLICLGLSRIW